MTKMMTPCPCMIQSVNIADFHNLICIKSLLQSVSDSSVFLALSAERLHWTWVAASAASESSHISKHAPHVYFQLVICNSAVFSK